MALPSAPHIEPFLKLHWYPVCSVSTCTYSLISSSTGHLPLLAASVPFKRKGLVFCFKATSRAERAAPSLGCTRNSSLLSVSRLPFVNKGRSGEPLILTPASWKLWGRQDRNNTVEHSSDKVWSIVLPRIPRRLCPQAASEAHSLPEARYVFHW